MSTRGSRQTLHIARQVYIFASDVSSEKFNHFLADSFGRFRTYISFDIHAVARKSRGRLHDATDVYLYVPLYSGPHLKDRGTF